MTQRVQRTRNVLAGATVGLFGLGTAAVASLYDVGTLLRMGPGYFPLVVGCLMALIGAVLVFQPASAANSEDDEAFRLPDLRGGACIVLAIVAFIALAENAGLIPATCVCVFIAAMGDRTMTLKSALILTAVVTVAGVGLFAYGLKIQLPLVAGWM
jgi:drug/metabolite transporter (DMT)-like permease